MEMRQSKQLIDSRGSRLDKPTSIDVAESHSFVGIGRPDSTATWGDGSLKNNHQSQNYSPPQGHVGCMNSCVQHPETQTGLFSPNPTGVDRDRNKVINLETPPTGGDIPLSRLA